jgi:protein gp37
VGETTGVGWTDHTVNFWWGCAHKSEECNACYAEALANRWGHDVWGKKADRRVLSDTQWRLPFKLDKMSRLDVETGGGLGRRHRVFCSSMADVFEDHPIVNELRPRVFEIIEQCTSLDWQLLTKRPELVAEMVPAHWMRGAWPLHVGLGTTAGLQRRVDERMPLLTALPAPLLFVSIEPNLGPVELELDRWPVDWVIVGGESAQGGHKPRRTDLEWVRSVIDQCAAVDVPVFVKQMGAVLGRELGCADRAGEDWSAWPAWARVREFPDSPADR